MLVVFVQPGATSSVDILTAEELATLVEPGAVRRPAGPGRAGRSTPAAVRQSRFAQLVAKRFVVAAETSIVASATRSAAARSSRSCSSSSGGARTGRPRCGGLRGEDDGDLDPSGALPRRTGVRVRNDRKWL